MARAQFVPVRVLHLKNAVVRVPLFINQGEVLKIDTRSGEYVSRA